MFSCCIDSQDINCSIWDIILILIFVMQIFRKKNEYQLSQNISLGQYILYYYY